MKILIAILLGLASLSISAQKIYTKNGQINFYSDAPMEKIEGSNSKATSVIDLESGAMQWSVLIKAFHFEKALMEEHFNENYMESSKYPKAIFKGNIENIEDVDLNSDGEYPVEISGDLSIHGKSNPITTSGMFRVKNGEIIGRSEFNIAVADYDIEVPALVRDNIAKEVSIAVEANYLVLQ